MREGRAQFPPIGDGGKGNDRVRR